MHIFCRYQSNVADISFDFIVYNEMIPLKLYWEFIYIYLSQASFVSIIFKISAIGQCQLTVLVWILQ